MVQCDRRWEPRVFWHLSVASECRFSSFTGASWLPAMELLGRLLTPEGSRSGQCMVCRSEKLMFCFSHENVAVGLQVFERTDALHFKMTGCLVTDCCRLRISVLQYAQCIVMCRSLKHRCGKINYVTSGHDLLRKLRQNLVSSFMTYPKAG
jgi:hypothetical protein